MTEDPQGYTETLLASDPKAESFSDLAPDDTARQMNARWYVRGLSPDRTGRVLDFGCGDGNSVDLFREHLPNCDWSGLDVERSGAVGQRTRTDADFHTYDGLHVPFGDDTFDIVYSSQVFEHVRHPEPLLAEIKRILKPGGAFIGGVSYMETLHGASVFNFTPHGWFTVLRDAGIEPLEFRAGTDGISMTLRRLKMRLGEPNAADAIPKPSPFNAEILARTDWDNKRKTLEMLRITAHIIFVARA